MKQLLFIFIMVILWINPSSTFADDRLDHCEPFRDQIVTILEDNGVSSDYFYLAVCESRCKIKESNKGARGFFQLMKPTYLTYKSDDCTRDDIDDIRCNTIAAANYIKHLQIRFKKMSYLIKAYNRGGHNLIKKGSTREADGLSNCVMRYVSFEKEHHAK